MSTKEQNVREHFLTGRRMRFGAIITVPILFVMLLALVVVIRQAPRAHAATGGFVTTQGTQFMLNGAPFEFAGSNNYYPEYSPKPMVDDLFANAQAMGLKVVRIWAFYDIGSLNGTTVPTTDGQGVPSVYFQYWDTTSNSVKINAGANGLQMLDYAISSAAAHNIK